MFIINNKHPIQGKGNQSPKGYKEDIQSQYRSPKLSSQLTFPSIGDDTHLARLSAYHRLASQFNLQYIPQLLDFQNNLRNIPNTGSSLSRMPPPINLSTLESNAGTSSGTKPQFSDTKLVFKGYNFYKSWENFSKRMGGIKVQFFILVNKYVERKLNKNLQYKGYQFINANIIDYSNKHYYYCANHLKHKCDAMLVITGDFMSTELLNQHHSNCQCKKIQGVRLKHHDDSLEDRKPLQFGFLYPRTTLHTYGKSVTTKLPEFVTLQDNFIIDSDSRRYIWCWTNKSETIRLAKCANQFTTKCKASMQVSQDMQVLKRSADPHNMECLEKQKNDN
uniref:CSON002384 protein n=1 Tax=Culicoides sonorensis TaxID=179676 RepID=A0A336LVG3_CULSO